MSVFNAPPMVTGDNSRDVANLRDYLFKMYKSLNGIVGGETQAVTVSTTRNGNQIVRPVSGGIEADDVEKIKKNARELMSLIVKTGKELQEEIDTIEVRNFFVKYADDFAGDYPAVMYNVPTANTVYMGVCVSTATTAPTNPALYEWSRVKGNTGPQGEPGEDGRDGTSVRVIQILYGISNTASGEPSSWDYRPPTGIAKGKWLWVRTLYSDNSMSTTKSYVGTDGEDGVSVAVQSATKVDGVTTVVIADSEGNTTTLTIADGEDGDDGTPGTDGLNGYVHTAWANSADGQQDFSTSVSTGKKYLGVYTDNTLADSQDYRDYSWSLIKGDKGNQGDQGIQGPPGTNGQTTYLHIKYSDDGETFTPNQGEDLGAFIGMYTDFTETDSMTFSDYEWHRFADDTELQTAITNTETRCRNYTNGMTGQYDERYVAVSEFGTFKTNLPTVIAETVADTYVQRSSWTTELTDINGAINGLLGYKEELSGEIQRGIVLNPSTGLYEYGIAIAQQIVFKAQISPEALPYVPDDGHVYMEIDREQTFGLYTSTGWQFWIGGNKVGWFDSREQENMLHIRSAYAEESVAIGGYWKQKTELINGSYMFTIDYIGS